MNATSAAEPRAPRPAAPRLELHVQYAVPRNGLPAPMSIARWLDATLERAANLTVRFVGAGEGRRLNRAYRGRDYATNVLTFVYGARPLAADIVLCSPVIAREAKQQRKAVPAHYAHLVVHGALHAQGCDHEHARAARLMEQRETRILAAIGFADPYV